MIPPCIISRLEKTFGNPRLLHVDVTRSRELDEGRGRVIRVARLE